MRKIKLKYIESAMFLEQTEYCRVLILLKKLLLPQNIFSLDVKTKAKGLSVTENIKTSQNPRA